MFVGSIIGFFLCESNNDCCAVILPTMSIWYPMGRSARLGCARCPSARVIGLQGGEWSLARVSGDGGMAGMAWMRTKLDPGWEEWVERWKAEQRELGRRRVEG